MDGPWAKYQTQPAQPAQGPWAKYGARPAVGVTGTASVGVGAGGAPTQTAQAQGPETVMETPGVPGGRILRHPDGSLGFTSPGAATGDQAVIERLMQGATYAEATMPDWQESAVRENPVVARATSFLQGLPFVGEWTDEATGAMHGEVAGRGQAFLQDAMEARRPGQAMALQVAGGVAGAIPMAVAAAPAVVAAAPSSLAAQAGAGLAAGAVAGGTEGAIAGAGRNEADRGRGAVAGGLLGTAMGGALGAVAPAIQRGARNLIAKFKTSDIRTIAQQFGVSDDAARVVKQSLLNDDLDAAEQAIRRAGGDAMLADAGPGTRQLLDDAMSAGGEATRIGRDAVETRAAKAAPEINNALDNVLGPPEGVRAAARNISQRTSQLRQTAYDRAYSTAVDYAGDQGRKIEGVLSRIPPKTLRAAIDEANDAMRAAGTTNRQIMAEIADDGAVTFREMPNVQQLDEIKKALGNFGAENVDQFGRPTAAGRRANMLARDLRDAIGDAVPTYRVAVKLGGDKIAEDQALALGRRALLAQTTREDVGEFLTGGMSREARDAFKRGLRGYIDDTLANVQRTITDPNIDAREAMTAIKQLSSRANREKVSSVLGESQARKLFDVIDRATMKLELRAGVSRNSATAIRTAGREAMDTQLAPGAVGTLARGKPVNAGQRIIQTLTNTTPQADLARRQALYAEIAESLTSIRGPEAERAMGLVRQAMRGQPLSEAQARQVANLITAAGAIGGYQTGTQSLAR